MKQMIYRKDRTRAVLDSGTYRGIKYFILSLGTHPTAYLQVPLDDKRLEKARELIHGGITYSEKTLKLNRHTVIHGDFIGWDYAHWGDYCGFFEDMIDPFGLKDLKKWTTEEILAEVKLVINAMLERDKHERQPKK